MSKREKILNEEIKETFGDSKFVQLLRWTEKKSASKEVRGGLLYRQHQRNVKMLTTLSFREQAGTRQIVLLEVMKPTAA